ncbi:MAG: LamG domain-containing protein [Nanoarchaeota archaeon]|nr:LamG domain-containing protein [Nanoarchaeota archaeon]
MKISDLFKYIKSFNILLLILLFFSLQFIFSSIIFTPPTPDDLTVLDENSNVSITLNISSFKFTDFIFSWNLEEEIYYSENLVLMLNLNNNSQINENSSNVVDSSLYSNNGFLVGDAVFSNFSRFGGNSVYFDGTNDWIEIPDDESLDDMTQFTFEAWVFREFSDTQARGIASKRIGTGTNGRSWSIFSFTNGHINFDVIGDRHNSGVSLPQNQWVHLTVTFDGTAPSSQRKRFYYNGQLVATTASSQTSIPRNSNSDLTIGTLNKNYGQAWQGYIDEVRIWDIALSESEIQNRFNSNFEQINSSSFKFQTQKNQLQTGVFFYNATISNATVSNLTELRSIVIGSSFIYFFPTPFNDSILFQNFVEINSTILNLNNRTIQINLYNSSGIIESFNFTSLPAFINITNLEYGKYEFNASLIAQNGSLLETLETRKITLSEDLEIDLAFNSPTPNNFQTIIGNSTLLNLSISTNPLDFLREFLFNFNSNSYSIYDNSLVAMFNLDNNSLIGETNSLAVDSSRFQNNATISGASWNSEGVYGSALSFSSGTHSMTIPSFSEFSNQNQITIMGWIKQNSLSLNQYFLWGDGNVLVELGSSQSPTGNDILRLRWNLEGDWRNNHHVIGGLETNVWNHWAFVFNSGDTSIYKNGELITTGSDSQTSISVNSPNYVFGTRTGDNLNGLIDEIKLYTRALNSNEILFHYNSRLKQKNIDNWTFFTNASELTNGTYSYFTQATNSGGAIFSTPIRYFNIGIGEFNITIIEPVNNSKFLNSQIISLELNSTAPLEFVGVYVNGDSSNISTLTSANNFTWDGNLEFFGRGLYTLTFIYNTSSSPIIEEQVSIRIIEDAHSQVSKEINFDSSNIYIVDIEFTPILENSFETKIYDFVDELFNFASFSPIYNFLTMVSNTLFVGYLFEFEVPTLQNSSISYAISSNSNNSSLLDNYIVGFE